MAVHLLLTMIKTEIQAIISRNRELLKPERLATLTEVGKQYSTPELFFQQTIDYGCCGCNVIFTVCMNCMASCISYTAKFNFDTNLLFLGQRTNIFYVFTMVITEERLSK